jgi:mono/diheme cytochrome c family protein
MAQPLVSSWQIWREAVAFSSLVRTGLIGLSVACSASWLACGGGGASEPSAGESSTGAEASSEYDGPIASTDVEAGKAVFATYCDDCHPDGDADVGPSLIADPHVAAQLRQQIREGSGKMKPFPEKRVSKDDLEALLA